MGSIDGVGGPYAGGIGGARPLARRSASGFTLPQTPAEAEFESASVNEAAPAPHLDTMLALQEYAYDDWRERAARRHGLMMLRELTALQLALLGGRRGPDDLARLASLADTLPPTDDPAIAGALQALALRARIELARGQ